MLSVLMSVYVKDNPFFLEEALKSVWDSQILKPDQIVLIKDGPLTDTLERVIKQWQEYLGDIFTLVSLEKNQGLGAALNVGITHCRFELIARMDSDDVSLPKRFAKQVAFMNANPGIVASSATLEEFDQSLVFSKGRRTLPVSHEGILKLSKRRSPLNHIPSIFRKSIIVSVGGYPPLRNAQDYGLWSLLIIKGHKLANLPDTLAHIRAGDEMLARRGWSYFKQELQLLKFQREIGFLSAFYFYTNIVIRAIIRAQPQFIKNRLYRVVRKSRHRS